jgi:hypothetical protein
MFLISIIAEGLFAQNAAADKKISEIESFKKYEVTRLDNNALLKTIGDSTIEITEVTNYQKGNKKDQSGKVTENSKYKSKEVKRTYYFNEESAIFAIVDHVKYNDNTTDEMTYYFDRGQLTHVFDKSKNDITNTVDKEALYNWIIQMFDESALLK